MLHFDDKTLKFKYNQLKIQPFCGRIKSLPIRVLHISPETIIDRRLCSNVAEE